MSGDTKSATIADTVKDRDAALDRELEQTFPASDPPSSTQPGTRSGAPDRVKKDKTEEPRKDSR